MSRYPHEPGHQGTDTSIEAAISMSDDACTLRGVVVEYLRRCGVRGSTADECATALNETVLAIRPRFTELRHLGYIRDSGDRRLNISGRRAIVWRMKRWIEHLD